MIRVLFRLLLALLIVVIVIPVAVVAIGLNSQSGRDFAVRQINHFAGGQVTVAGLGGHFPADLKLAHVEVKDSAGTYLTADGLELRWLPAQLLQWNIHVTSLTAADIDLLRQPVAGKPSKGGSIKLPPFHLAVDRLEFAALHVPASLAGQKVTLDVTGAAHLQSQTQGDIALDAVAANGAGTYHLQAGIDPKIVNVKLVVAEPPDGLIGHFAGPQVHDPLNLSVTVDGPRDHAALDFAAALGAAQLTGKGTIGLDPDAPAADVVLTVPALAPFGNLAAQKLGGSTTLHLVASQMAGTTNISLDGSVALTQAPGPLAKLVGPNGKLSLLMTLADNAANIQQLNINGAGFSIGISGSVAQSGVDLDTSLSLNDVATLSPEISGPVAEIGDVAGTAKDFAVDATLTGNISQRHVPTGPFTITVNAQHLPQTPIGTVTGSGALEGFPLLLDAQFARTADGAVSLLINNALWRSLSVQANLALAKGATLPTGQAKFAVGRLADFSAFVPVKLAGSIAGDFSHQNAQDFALNVKADNLLFSPALGMVNATVNANGPVAALAVKLNATIAKLMTAPAKIATAAVVNLDKRSANISALNASWRGLNARLLGPVGIETQPAMIAHHLAIAVNGGVLKVDGMVSPRLNVRVALQDMPVSVAKLFAPAIDATGTISATANVTGTTSAPGGNFTLDARRIKFRSGPGAALPAADLTAKASVAGKSANMSARLNVGGDITLNADGLVPLSRAGAMNLHLTGMTDLRLLDPILAAQGTTIRGVITPDITVSGTPAAPAANGRVSLSGGSVQNVASGLNLIDMSAHVVASGRLVSLADFTATAGKGTISGHGTVDLAAADFPIFLLLNANNATPVSSDIVTENLDAALQLKGALRGALALGGTVNILGANINIPQSLPPSVADLPILMRGQKPPPPPSPPPPIALDLTIRAKNQVFVRGDGLFAELGGRLHITGTAANPYPEGGFTLVRGSFSLAGTNLQFTSGTVSFNGAGFMPTLDLEATSTTSNNTTVSLIVGGTAAKPTITLSSSPPMPSDEILAQLLFAQNSQNLTAFQAASLAAALAQLAGVGGGVNPLDKVRNALGLDQLSLGGSGSGAPSIQAGRYVAPGVYVGAQQATNGQGTQATVQVNLYKGLKLQTATGTSSGSSGNSSSVGLTYQFNY